MSVHFSSATDEWSTPQYIWKFMEHIVGRFRLDAAATAANAICKHFIGPGSVQGEDALQVKWPIGPVWCNPPYSQVEAFMRKALQESRTGGGNGCLFGTCPHRHRLVAPIRNQRGGLVSSWAFKVRGSKEQRTLPQRNNNF